MGEGRREAERACLYLQVICARAQRWTRASALMTLAFSKRITF